MDTLGNGGDSIQDAGHSSNSSSSNLNLLFSYWGYLCGPLSPTVLLASDAWLLLCPWVVTSPGPVLFTGFRLWTSFVPSSFLCLEKGAAPWWPRFYGDCWVWDSSVNTSMTLRLGGLLLFPHQSPERPLLSSYPFPPRACCHLDGPHWMGIL